MNVASERARLEQRQAELQQTIQQIQHVLARGQQQLNQASVELLRIEGGLATLDALMERKPETDPQSPSEPETTP